MEISVYWDHWDYWGKHSCHDVSDKLSSASMHYADDVPFSKYLLRELSSNSLPIQDFNKKPNAKAEIKSLIFSKGTHLASDFVFANNSWCNFVAGG